MKLVVRGGSALGMWVALSLTSCTYSYSARLANEVQRGDLSVQMRELHVVHEIQEVGTRANWVRAGLSLRIERVPPDVRLIDAYASSVERVPCAGEGGAILGRTSGQGADAPLVPGETISLRLSSVSFSDATSGRGRIDLALKTPAGSVRCVSLPLTDGRGVALSADDHFTFGADFSLEGFTNPLGAVSQFITATAQIGYWVDSLHVELGGGVAGAGCPDPTCSPSEKDMNIDYTTSPLFYGGVRSPIYEHGEWSIGAALRYRAIHLFADTVAGREALWMHGPVLSPYFAVVSPYRSTDGTSIGGSREALISLEIPVGYALAENGERSVSVGANASFLFTAF